MTIDNTLDAAIVEKAARAGFEAAAANAAREYGLGKPVTWDEHLTARDREYELNRTRAILTAAAPLIAAKALRKAAAEMGDEGFLGAELILGGRADAIGAGQP